MLLLLMKKVRILVEKLTRRPLTTQLNLLVWEADLSVDLMPTVQNELFEILSLSVFIHSVITTS